jgi:hypothetical protein
MLRLLAATWDKPCRLNFKRPLMAHHDDVMDLIPRHVRHFVHKRDPNSRIFEVMHGAPWLDVLI